MQSVNLAPTTGVAELTTFINPHDRVEDTRAELLPELVELAEDEESSVRLAAFDTIINLMEMMDGGRSHDCLLVPQRHPRVSKVENQSIYSF